MIEYRSIADLDRLIVRNLIKVPRDIDIVVGIPRSGVLAASILAMHMNLPFAELDSFLAGTFSGSRREVTDAGKRYRSQNVMRLGRKLKVLVIDDSVQTGRQIQQVKRTIKECSLEHEFIYGAVYVSEIGARHVDLSFEVISSIRVFEWNLMHGSFIRHACVDMDGVLCRDPLPEENDDGPRYCKFLREADYFVLPSSPIGWIVTCRLEKYRAHTIDWLDRHGVRYRELLMLDLPSKAERQRLQPYLHFKAEAYLKTSARLFIESSECISRKLVTVTNRPVFCTDTWTMFQPDDPKSIREQGNMPSRSSMLRRVYRGLRRRVAARIV